MHWFSFCSGHRIFQRSWPLQMNPYMQAQHRSAQFSCPYDLFIEKVSILRWELAFCSSPVILAATVSYFLAFSIAQGRDFFTWGQLQTSSATLLSFNNSQYQLLQQALVTSACLSYNNSLGCKMLVWISVLSSLLGLQPCIQGNIMLLVGALSQTSHHQMQMKVIIRNKSCDYAGNPCMSDPSTKRIMEIQY